MTGQVTGTGHTFRRRAGASDARRVISTLAGLSAVLSSAGATSLVLSPVAIAQTEPSDNVDNDWGQSAAQAAADVAAQVEADPRVVAARMRYRRAVAHAAAARRAARVAKEALGAVTLGSGPGLAVPADVAKATRVERRAVAAVLVARRHLATVRAEVARAVQTHHFVRAPYVALPARPTGLTAAPADTQVSVTWPAVPGATSYRIFRDGAQVGSGPASSFADTGLANGTPYSYTIRAINAAGWSPLSDIVDATPAPALPGVPVLTVTPGDGQVTLSWTSSALATSYRIARDGVAVATTTGTSWTATGLLDGTTYAWTVQALVGSLASPPSAPIVCIPVATAPAAPTALVAAAGDRLVTLTWAASPGATSYGVYRNGTKVASPTTTAYVDAALTNGASYSYAVVAFRDNSPASALSTPVSAQPAAPPLAIPTGLTTTPGDARVTLSWSAVPGATSYRVFRDGSQATNRVSTSWTDTGLVNGIAHTYYVVAVGPSSTSPSSATVTATPAAAVVGAPTGLSGTPGNTTVALSWSAVSGATSYVVYRDGTSVGTVATTTFTDTGLTNATTYAYRVTALTAGVESAASATVQVTPDVPAPTVPTGVTATPGDARVVLSWTASANATSYRVYRSGGLLGSPTTTSYTDLGLTNGSAYSYTVVAVNATSPSAASASVIGYPVAPAPAAPTGVTATAGDTQVTLSWSAVANATAYRVYRNGVQIASPTGTGWTDTALTNGATYTYFVTAVNATTQGAASGTVTATPAAAQVNGTFTGATAAIAQGHGTLHVVIVITNSRITSATGTLLTNDGSETRSINAGALPRYDTEAIAASSAAIAKVSGASLTWPAYKTSLQSALTQAGL